MSKIELEKIEKQIAQLSEEILNIKENCKSCNSKPAHTDNRKIELLQQHLMAVTEIPGDTMIFSIDNAYNYTSFNLNYKNYVKELFRTDIEVGMNILEVMKYYKDFSKEQKNLERALKGEEFSQFGDYEHEKKRFYYEDIYKPICDSSKNINGIVVFYTNITERKRSDQTWEVLLKISEAVHASPNLEDFLKTAHSELSNLTEVKNFYIALYDEEKDGYYFPFHIDEFDDAPLNEVVSLKRSLTDYVRQRGVPLLISEGEDKELIRKGEVDLIGTPSPSWIGVPLKTGHKSIGVMVAQSYNYQGLYSTKDLEIMAFVSDHIATAIERKRIEQELKVSTDQMKLAQSIAKMGNWEMDFSSDKIIASEETLRIFGFDLKSKYVTFDQVRKLVHPNDKSKIDNILHHIITENEPYEQEFKFYRANDHQEVVLLIKAEAVLDSNKKAVKARGIIQDISKMYMDRKELQMAKEKAEESDRLKSAFLANMSHEIRTPMNAILGFSRLLANPSISHEQREEYNEYIINSGNNLLNLINDIIDVAKIEAGISVVQESDCAINKILNEIYTTYEKQKVNSGKSHISLKLIKANNDIDFTIEADPVRVHQIISNLVSNSMKFIEKGSVEFGYTIEDMDEKKIMKFYVRDTGIGIPANKAELVFSRFGQIDGAKIKNPVGTGLGLSICKHLIEAMGGKIWFESVIDLGTTFYFTLPFKPIQPNKKAAILKEEIKEKYNIQGKNILVVEDNPINRALITDTFKLFNIKAKIDIAENGKEAIKQLTQNEYDIILMDVRMPIMDGFATTQYIRKNMLPPKSQTPILGLSAQAMKEDKEMSIEVGMNGFLTKPFVQEELFKQIHILTSKNKQTEMVNTTNEIKLAETEIQLESELEEEKTHKDSITKSAVPLRKLIDLTLLNTMYQGLQDKVNNILNLCLTNIPKQINDLEKHFNAKDYPTLRVVAHSLKTSLNYLGLKDLHHTAKNIELHAANEKNINEIPEMISEIKAVWELASREIKQILSKN